MAMDLMGKGRPGKGAGIMSPSGGGKGKKASKGAMQMLTKRKMKGKR
jgi:hypothetical protein